MTTDTSTETPTAPEGPRTRTGCPHKRAARRRRMGLAVFLVGGGSLLGGGAFAAWQSSAGLTSGTVAAATSGVDVLDASGGTFTAGVADLLPGDFFYRYADVVNTTPTAGAFGGTVAATGGMLGNLVATVERCSVAWTISGATSTCSGTTTSIVAAETTIPSGGLILTLGTINPATANAAHLRYRFKLADAAPSTLMGTTSTLTIGATGTMSGNRNRTLG